MSYNLHDLIWEIWVFVRYLKIKEYNFNLHIKDLMKVINIFEYQTISKY